MLRQPQYTELGKLIDISETGLAFLCINQGDWSTSPFEADILFNNRDKDGETLETLKGLPLKPIAYCRKNHPANPLDLPGILTRCGVEFDRLTPEQKTCLDRFINEHTSGHA